jgi:hypothetical protein
MSSSSVDPPIVRRAPEEAVDSIAVIDHPSGQAPAPTVRDRYDALVPWLEAGISLVLVLVCLAYTARFLSQMRHNSLWTDELFSIINFGNQGPLHAATDYRTANNHVLQTVLSAATPGSLFDPTRVRLISFVAVVASQVIIVVEFARRRWFLIGAVMLFLVSVNFEWLNENTQARGYGLVALCAVICSLVTWRIIEEDPWWSLIVLAIATAAGIYALPSFAFFAGPLWLFLGVVTRRRRVWLAGAGGAALVLLLYLPILKQLVDAFRGYGDEFGRSFTSLSNVSQTLKDYLFSPSVTGQDVPAWVVFAVFGAILVAPQFVPRPIRTVSRVLSGAVVVVFVIALILQTPIERTLAFVIVPFALSALVLLGWLYYRPRFRELRPIIAALIVLPMAIYGRNQTADLKVPPVEDWAGAARVIDQTFPSTMSVGVLRDPYFLNPFLKDKDRAKLNLDALTFAAGRQVFVDVFFKSSVPDTDVSRDSPNVLDYRIPQQYGLYTRVLAAPPNDTRVASVAVNGQDEPTDRFAGASPAGYVSPPLNTLTQPLTLTVRPTAGPSRSMLIATTNNAEAPITATARLRNGQLLPVAVDQQSNGIRLLLGDRDVEQIDLTVHSFPVPAPLIIRDLWIYSPT